MYAASDFQRKIGIGKQNSITAQRSHWKIEGNDVYMRMPKSEAIWLKENKERTVLGKQQCSRDETNQKKV